MAKSISIDSLSEEIQKELEKYNKYISTGVKSLAYVVTKDFTQDTKKDAPKSNSKRSGTFIRNITFKKSYESATSEGYMWYVKNPEYRLAHLLKNGHQTKNGGRTKAQDFITNNYEKAEKKYIEGVEEIIKNGH